MKRKLTLGAGGAVVLAVFGYFAFGGLGDSLVYFLTPSELMAKGDAARGASVRLGGMVEPGSVVWDAEATHLRFRIIDGDTAVAVESAGVPPQMFLEAADRNVPIGALVEGHLAEGGVFRASNLLVKHSEEYRAPDHADGSAEYYRDLFRESAAGAER